MLISYMVTQLCVLIYPLLKVHSSPNVSSALLQLDQERVARSLSLPSICEHCGLMPRSFVYAPEYFQAVLSILTQSSGFILDQQSSRPILTYSRPNSKAEISVGCCCSTSLFLNHTVRETFPCSLAQGLKSF